MNYQNKPQAIIEYAVKNGLDPEFLWSAIDNEGRNFDEKVYFFIPGQYDLIFPIKHLLFSHDLAKAVFGEKKKAWLGKFYWHSLYEIDGEIFNSYQELMSSWIYSGEKNKPSLKQLREIPDDLNEGIEVCAGKLIKYIETINKGWQHHIQQAVISDDPIEYYFNFIKTWM